MMELFMDCLFHHVYFKQSKLHCVCKTVVLKRELEIWVNEIIPALLVKRNGDFFCCRCPEMEVS